MRRLIVLILCIALSHSSAAAPQTEAELHLSEAVDLAGEAKLFSDAVHQRPYFSRFYPRASTVFKPGRSRKEILSAAVREANSAVYLDPDLHDAWYVLALCYKTREIGKYGESLDIFLELTHRGKIQPDLKRVVLWEIVHFPALEVSPEKLTAEVDKALAQLSSMSISDLERLHIHWNLVRNAVRGWKDPSKASARVYDAFGESERFWKIDKDKRIIGYAYAVQDFILLGRRIDERDMLDAIQPYLTADLPEKKTAVWHHVGNFYEKQKQWAKAVAAYRKSADYYREACNRGDAVDVYGLDFLGLGSAADFVRILVQTNQAEEAVRLGEPFLPYPGEEVFSKRPDIYKSSAASELRYHLASAHEKMGKDRRSLELYEETARRTSPPSKIDPQKKIRELRRRLQVDASGPLKEILSARIGLPYQPVTALAAADGKIWAGVFPGVHAGLPILLYRQTPADMKEAGLYLQDREGLWKKVSIPGIADSTPVTALAIFGRKLWVATFGGGLASYNLLTTSWTVLNEGSGLPMNHILTLYPDKDRLWIGFGDFTRGGLGWLNPEDLSIYVFPAARRKTDARSGPPAGSVTAITRWGNDMYAAEYLVGVKRFERERENPEFQFVSELPSPTPPHVKDRRDRISALRVWDQNLWIGFFSAGSSPGLNYALGGISRIGKNMESNLYMTDEGLPDNSITSFAVLEGTLIAGTAGDKASEGGLACYDEYSNRWFPVAGFQVLSLCPVGGNLYVGTSEGVRVFERR